MPDGSTTGTTQFTLQPSTQQTTFTLTVVPPSVSASAPTVTVVAQPAPVSWTSPQVVVTGCAAMIALFALYVAAKSFRNAKDQRVIADQARTLAEEKLRLDLFDRRLKIYTNVTVAIRESRRLGRPLEWDAITQLFEDAKIASFIFPPEVAAMIVNLWAECLQRRRLLKDYEGASENQWPANIREENKTLQASILKFDAQVDPLFKEHLDFTEIEDVFIGRRARYQSKLKAAQAAAAQASDDHASPG